MSFKYEIVHEEDDERFLNCDEVESLDNLDIVADQLRQDAIHLESRFPAGLDGSGVVARPICADMADAQPANSHVENQMQLCLTQVEAVLADRKKRKANQRKWFRGLTAGISLAIMIATGFVVQRSWNELQMPQDQESAAGLAASSNHRAVVQPFREPEAMFSHVALARDIHGLGIGNTNQTQIQSGLNPTPVSFEIPSKFLHASGPEMEGLLDLFESESNEAVTIEF